MTVLTKPRFDGPRAMINAVHEEHSNFSYWAHYPHTTMPQRWCGPHLDTIDICNHSGGVVFGGILIINWHRYHVIVSNLLWMPMTYLTESIIPTQMDLHGSNICTWISCEKSLQVNIHINLLNSPDNFQVMWIVLLEIHVKIFCLRKESNAEPSRQIYMK